MIERLMKTIRQWFSPEEPAEQHYPVNVVWPDPDADSEPPNPRDRQ